ncbi:MAG: hypothetical protein KKA61_01545 [Nanoarchaeota archaeon]|nr:hypothetical protein [Nanoarchaeota archaeon]MBU4493030.1 hypothetical protein [Nanoarchaeota archaeon]
MNREMMKNVEEIIGKNLSRIIKIHYKVNIKGYTSPGYIIPCSESQLKEESSRSNFQYIKICSALNSKREPAYGVIPSKINIKDIYWIEVLDYPVFHEGNDIPLSDIIEVCLKNKWNKPGITRLFTLDNKENIEKSLGRIKKITNSKYPSLNFEYANQLVVLDSIGEIN